MARNIQLQQAMELRIKFQGRVSKSKNGCSSEYITLFCVILI